MSGPPNAENIVSSGQGGTVEYAARANGKTEVKEWLSAQRATIQARFGVMFDQLVKEGLPFPNASQFKKLSNDVYEFRRGGVRVFCVKHGRRWLLTNTYVKGHSKKHQMRAADRALAIANEHHEREREKIKKGG